MKIFLSYSFADKEKVEHVKTVLLKRNIDEIIDYESYVKSINFIDELRYTIQKSDCVILFLSDVFLKSDYSLFELTESLHELRLRNILIIPVIIEKCSLPSDLLKFDIIDFSKSFDKGIERLLNRLSIKQKIDFESLHPQIYEKIVQLFLKEYGFNIIQGNDNRDIGADYICEYYSKDPFGNKIKETWMIEVKFYKSERFSINSVYQLYNYKKNNFPIDSKLLLITNSILTSPTIEYLDNLVKNENTHITVIDGPLLEKLILKRKKLARKISEVINASNK